MLTNYLPNIIKCEVVACFLFVLLSCFVHQHIVQLTTCVHKVQSRPHSIEVHNLLVHLAPMIFQTRS
uniref:Uncharacterized protein n=1 Tax=Arundo donax TaxID=35708 RepID=A0A0A9HAK1_ARUDO